MLQRFALLATLSGLAVGCGSASPTAPPPPDVSLGLNELAEVYKYRATQGVAPPTKVEDLSEHEDALPNALQPIRDGQIVVVWRIGYTPSSSNVLAYAKDAPERGGKVLLRNGTVKEMSADEFRSAKK
jgi:hypothetical protein